MKITPPHGTSSESRVLDGTEDSTSDTALPISAAQNSHKDNLEFHVPKELILFNRRFRRRIGIVGKIHTDIPGKTDNPEDPMSTV